MENNFKLGCVVMAAGFGSRYGSNKLTAQLQGRSLILRTLEAIPDMLFDSVVVVTQYPEVERIAKDFHFTVIYNNHPEYGLSYTIQLGLTSLQDCDGVLFLVSDQPFLTQTSVAQLVALWKESPQSIAAVAHNGKRGNPCFFPSRLFHELLDLQGDCGGNAVIRRHPEDLILLEIGSQELIDVDTPETLDSLKCKSSK